MMLIYVYSGAVFGQSNPDFNLASQKEKMACLLGKPFIFGASISAGYQDLSDATTAFTKLQMSQLLGRSSQHLGNNPDPITRLAHQYVSNPQVTNISEILNTMEHSSVGADQFLTYIQDPAQKQTAVDSTVLASIDGLYWPTIYGDDCSWAEYAMERTEDVILFAKNNKIPLLLGNVSYEDESKVAAVIKAGWEPPKIKCAQKVNSFLIKKCRLEHQCYIIDMHRMVENLKGNLGPRDQSGIFFEGQNYEYNEFRQDGVHLYNSPSKTNSRDAAKPIPNGMRYLMTYIEKSIAWNLPDCRK